MDMVIFFTLLICVLAFVIFLGSTIYSIIRKKEWKKNAYITGGLLIASFLLFVFFGTSITDENKVMSEQMSTIQSQEKSIEEYEGKVNELETEIETLNSDLKETESKNENVHNDELNETITALENDIQNKDEEIEKLTSSSNEAKSLQEENKKLSSEIEGLNKSNEELSKEIDSLKADLKENEESSESKEEKKTDEQKGTKKTDSDDKKTPEQNIEDTVIEANSDVKSVTIDKDGDLYQPNIIIDGTGYLWAIDSSAKADIADVVYALKETDYDYGFINIVVEMEFIDTYGNESLSTGYEAEFTQEILDKLTDEKYMIVDKIDNAANYWFKHPGIE